MANVQITTNNGNSPYNIAVQENNTAVATIEATGDGPIEWTLDGGDDDALFAIDAETGVVTKLTPFVLGANDDFDADGVYDVGPEAIGPGEGNVDNINLHIAVIAATWPADTFPQATWPEAEWPQSTGHGTPTG